LFERGVDSQGFARIRSKENQTLFDGHTTLKMKDKSVGSENRVLANFFSVERAYLSSTNNLVFIGNSTLSTKSYS
jgi:hypothetical protein